MPSNSARSVTQIIGRLKSDDRSTFDRAAADVWRRYADELLHLVRRRLGRRARVRTDAEDVLQSVYKSFCLRQQKGEYDLNDRDDLWRLLVSMARNKAANAATHHSRRKRDYRREQADAVAAASAAAASCGDGVAPAVERLPDAKPTAAEVVAMEETIRERLKCLPEDLRALATKKLAGFTNEEVAAEWNRTVRTVERKLARIREIWQSGQPPAADELT